MKGKLLFLLVPVLIAMTAALGTSTFADSDPEDEMKTTGMTEDRAQADGKELTDEEWRERLTPEEYRVMRQKGTERAFTGAYWDLKDDGTYLCASCGNPLFTAEDKFDSGTGWPSYSQPAGEASVDTRDDRSHGMVRTEVVCQKCEAHLGHVFDDGPGPEGLRYCINSVSLDFQGEGDGDLPEGPPPCEIPPETTAE
jgi:peptide-methionine (R)-S-oxide reductase